VGTYAAGERNAGEYPDLARVAALARRWWWALVAGAVAAAVLVLMAGARTGSTYEAQARLLVGPVGGDLLVLRGAGQQAETLAQLATSHAVLDRVRRRLGPAAPKDDLALLVRASADEVSRVLTIAADTPTRGAAAPLANAVAAEVQRLSPARVRRDVRVVDPAVTPPGPVGSGTKVLAAIAMLATVLGLLALILVADSFRGRIMDEDELVELGALPHLATLRLSRGTRGVPEPPVGPQAPDAEAYRLLAGRLDLAVPASAKRSLLVTGVQRGEGSADVAAGIATAFARDGEQVVLIDADTETGELTRRLGLEGHAGLSELLLALLGGRRTPRLADVTVAGAPTLRIVPRGTASAARLPEARRAVRLVQRLSRGADVVVISAGPAAASAAALAWAAVADGTVLLVRRGRSRREDVTRAVRALHQVGARTVGTLLVDVPRPARNWRLRAAPERAAPAPRPAHAPQDAAGGR
jgi:Mrp family chromosome partitioning ATPase/capsular polysaccharide biosynthesis protein